MITAAHWTEKGEKFQFAIALDFIDQIEAKMDSEDIKQSDLARKLNVTEGRVSQIINKPGNLTLGMMVKCARAVGLKMSVRAYDDDDPDNTRGPIHADVFRTCWQQAGKPSDMWSLPSMTSVIIAPSVTAQVGYAPVLSNIVWYCASHHAAITESDLSRYYNVVQAPQVMFWAVDKYDGNASTIDERKAA